MTLASAHGLESRVLPHATDPIHPYPSSMMMFPFAESLELLLRHEGLSVETFVSAQEFLIVHARFAKLPGLDYSLPGLNGLALQKRVAVERHEMPIILSLGTAIFQ